MNKESQERLFLKKGYPNVKSLKIFVYEQKKLVTNW